MDHYERLHHTEWKCKYQVVLVSKCRRKVLFGERRRHLGPVFRTLTEQKDSRIEERYFMPDHVHTLISIPPNYAVSDVIGYIEGKSAIHIARTFSKRKWNFVGQHFWARC